MLEFGRIFEIKLYSLAVDFQQEKFGAFLLSLYSCLIASKGIG